jgi:hypothetical protein
LGATGKYCPKYSLLQVFNATGQACNTCVKQCGNNYLKGQTSVATGKHCGKYLLQPANKQLHKYLL